jgi:hypothetical protein
MWQDGKSLESICTSNVMFPSLAFFKSMTEINMEIRTGEQTQRRNQRRNRTQWKNVVTRKATQYNTKTKKNQRNYRRTRLTENKQLNISTKYEVYLNVNVEDKQAGQSNYTFVVLNSHFVETPFNQVWTLTDTRMVNSQTVIQESDPNSRLQSVTAAVDYDATVLQQIQYKLCWNISQ